MTEAELKRRRIQILQKQAALRERGDVEEFVNPPSEFFKDPRTGAMTSRELLKNNVDPSRSGAVVAGGMQGISFNYGDEAMGGLGYLEGGPEMANLRREQARAELEAQKEAHPNYYLGGQVAGSLGAAAPTIPLATGKSLMGTVGRGGAIGMAEGGLHGAGLGEDPEERAFQAGQHIPLGGLLGGVAPAAIAGINAVGRGAADMAGGLVGLGNQGRAERMAISSLNKSGVTPKQAASTVKEAAAEGQPQFRLMDAMGQAGQRRASGIVRGGGEGAEEIAEFLKQRQTDQADRVLAFTDDAFGTKGTTAEKTRAALKANRKSTADAMFDQAAKDAGPVDVQGAIEILDDTIGKMTNSGIKPTKVVKEYQKLRARLAGKTPEGDSTTLSDYESVLGIWRQVRDDVDKAYKSGDGSVGEALKPVRDALQASLEEASDLYRFGTDNYREASKVIESVDAGAQMAKKGRPEDTIPAFEAMTDQQKRAARVGYGDTISDTIQRNKAQAPNAAREYNSSKRAREASSIALSPRLLRDRIARENMMFETHQRALGGSRTADNIEDIADAGLLGDAGRAMSDMAAGNPGNAMATVGGALARKATGQNEGTRKIVARILMSQDPEKELAKALRKHKASEVRKRIVDALARATGREAYNNAPGTP